MKNICIITARGGSKRIPRKNIKLFCGKPIIAYSIEAAIESRMFDEVMVSTDDLEIAEIAKQYGATVPFLRSKETSSDFATTSDVLLEVLSKYQERGESFEYMCCLYPTAPFIRAERVAAAMKTIEENDAVEVIPVVAFSFPPQRCFEVEENGLMRYKYPEHMNTRSQDLPTLYHDAGQFYVYDVNKYIQMRGQIKGDMMPVILDEIEVQDIDNESDWKLAEMKFEILRRQQNG